MNDDTIAAISTPLGEGGLAIIRLSGPRALEIADSCFRPAGSRNLRATAAPSHTIQYGHIVREGHSIDEVLVSVLRAPRTFTREDMAEITGHGGILVAKQVLDAVLAAGARPAQPGEFTRRAFLNGRIDLTQAEAVLDVIHARTELSLAAANEQLRGRLAQRIHRLRDDLMHALAHIEAHIDFPDEDLSPDTRDQLLARLRGAVSLTGELLRTADEGQVLRRGVRAAIVGRPNAGKSSLLNLLLGRDRAIVSPLPGTTRDTIEETANIRGLPVVFIDTAGLREAADAIEQEGVRRSRESLDRADLVLHLVDQSEPWSPAEAAHLSQPPGKKRLVVRTKIDLPRRLDLPSGMEPASCGVSSLTGEGLEPLKDAIRDLILGGAVRPGMWEVMINSRHQDALRRGLTALEQAESALGGNSHLDLVALDLRIAVNAIGEVVGKTATEDLLDAIFSQFCIGK